jgi:dTMP kinase
MGALVAIEGIDGAGKGTQAALLVDHAERAGHSARLFSFPLYDHNPFSEAIAAYLNGAFGSVDEVHPELAGLLYACDRFHARPAMVAALDECDLVVCDRYVPSNLAHQGAKLDEPARTVLVDWLLEVEYGEFRLPRPDLVVLLDAPAAVAQEQVSRKAPRAYTARSRDIHEEAEGYLETTRAVYASLAARDPGAWRTVASGSREISDIGAEIWEAVRPLL